MAYEARTILRWSDCEVNTESLHLPQPPDFVKRSFSESQIPIHGDSADLCSSPLKKRVCHEKFSKKEALDIVASATNHKEAAQSMLELLAGRTFNDISGEDLIELEKTRKAEEENLTDCARM